MDSHSGKHRLRRGDLVSNIFALFSEEYDSSEEKTIFDINIPISQVKNYIEDRCDVKYTSDVWIYTQIKRYEDELGVRLFRKGESSDGSESFNLAVYKDMTTYTQFQHLYLTHKLKIANGIYDQIKNSVDEWRKNKSLKILLGSGTNIYHLANIIGLRAKEDGIHYHLYTHNLGVIAKLMEPKNRTEFIKIFTPAGVIDPVGNTIVGDDNNFYLSIQFDFIVQSTNTIFNRKLYVHTQEESRRKGVILKECRGVKILTLIRDEFKNSLKDQMHCYGELSDYDFIVVPRTRSKKESEYEEMMEKMEDFLIPEIVHWNYKIYKVMGEGCR